MSKKEKNIIEIILIIFIILIITFILFKIIKLVVKPTNTFMVVKGTISNEESLEGYIIREETIIKGDNYKNGMEQIKSEGEKVSTGEEAFRYYASNEEDLKEKILDVNARIQEALQQQSTVFSSDVKSIESQIELVLGNVRDKNNIKEIKECKKDINTYITKKTKILSTLGLSNTKLEELIKEKENYESLLTQNSEIIKATSSGIISYRVDGLESVLTPHNFENLNEETLKDLKLKTGQIVSTNNEEAKIVNNYYCYIATFIDSENSGELKIGNRIRIRLSTQEEINSIIEYIKEENGKKLLVLKVKKDVEYLINYRKISFEIIWWSETGLKIPNSSIIYDNGLSYIIRNRLGYLDKILIDVKKTNGNYTIINNYSTEDLEKLGYTIEKINNMKKISLYDEILVKPSTDELQ